jgi:hypothetical protein
MQPGASHMRVSGSGLRAFSGLIRMSLLKREPRD